MNKAYEAFLINRNAQFEGCIEKLNNEYKDAI